MALTRKATTQSANIHRNKNKKLNTYHWVALDKRGKKMKGEMAGSNASLVKAELRRQGLTPHTVREKSKSLFDIANKTIKSRDIAAFTRQLATMMAAGIPMVQSLEIIASGQTNARFKDMLIHVKQHIENGSSLFEALALYPRQFDELYRHLVHAGEIAGVLDTILDMIAIYKERMENIKGKIRKALFYPSMILVIALLISMIMLWVVVPVFAQTFKDSGAELPTPTQLVIAASAFIKTYGWLIIATFIASLAGIIVGKKRSLKFALVLDRLMLKLPVIGSTLHKSATARFARTLGVTFRAGVPLVDALDTVAGATGNLVYSDAIKFIRDDVSVGHSLRLAMNQTGLFPTMMTQMTAIGEESGALDYMLFKAADFYEDEINHAIDILSTLLEPIIMVILGILVGGMIISLYLPVFKLAGTL